MANRLSDIVNVNIDIAAPAVDSASFDNLLIVGPLPAATPPRPIPTVGVYTDLTEVTGAGYVAVGDLADPVGIAARIAFSQNPKPSRIYIAAQQPPKPLITSGDISIITEDNWQTAAGIGPDDEMPTDLPWLQVTYTRRDVSLMQVSVEKDGVVVWGNSLPTTMSPEAFLQVCLGTSSDTYGDQMNLDPAEFDGEYVVTLTSGQGATTTTMTLSLTFDGTDSFDVGPTTQETTPDVNGPVETLDAALDTTGWYVICAAGIPENLYEQIAEWTETQTKQFAYTFLSQVDPVGEVFYRSHGWCGLITDDDTPADVPAGNAYLHVGAVAKALAYPSGSETWAFKQLASLYPSTMSSTLKKLLTDGHSNYFTQYAGRNITMNGQVRAGEWIDVIRGRDWLQNDMQLRLFNLLLMNPKIPYTNGGIAKVQNEMIASLKSATERGIVAGDEFDEDGVLVPGFTTRVPNSQSLTATQKASRILEGCTFSARLAGAIHVISVNGNLTY